MSRIDPNRSGEMEVFVRVVELGGFTAAAHAFSLTPSAVSKIVSRLEVRLGARLLNRSTRRLQLTDEGQAFYDRALRIISDLDEAEREAAGGASPRGHLRINCNVAFGMHFLAPVAARFLEAYPALTIDLALSDVVVDLMEERADIAIRIGPLQDSGLVARKLGSVRMVVIASPGYLERHGAPSVPAELQAHRSIGWSFRRTLQGWPFLAGDAVETITPPVVARASDGEVARLLAISGAGLARLGLAQVAPDIAAGRLAPVLEPFNPGDREDIYAVYLGQGGPLPARVRAFLDFLAESVRAAAPLAG
jgi:DNA-binding transcriptional LysR family regulator